MLQDDKRIMEAILELNSFLIKYKLKPNDSNDFEDIDTRIIYNNQREEAFKFIVDNFHNFDEIYDKLKNINTRDYFKNFLEIIRNKSKNNYDLIETPFLILAQKRNYLLGKFAKYCGHFSQAFLYFCKSKERQIICDAYLIKSSIKQIYKLIRHFERDLEKDGIINGYVKNNTISNAFDSSKMKKSKFEEDIIKFRRFKRIFSCYHKEIDTEIEFFSYHPKDVIILIEFSASMCSRENRKIERTSNNSITIFDNYITENDRFGLFIFTEHVNPIVSLGNKCLNNVECIKDMISSLEKMTEEYDLEKDPNLRNALERLIDYFKKKSVPKRQKWVIVYTDSFKNDGLIKETIKKMEEYEINLLIVALNMNKDESNKFADVIKTIDPKNRNEIIENENVTRLAQIFRINGIIQENEKKFINERYDCEKENNLRKNL